MTAIIYNFDRWAEDDLVDETERLFSALERYTTPQLLELLYVGEEPGFFELVHGLFGVSDDSRLIFRNFSPKCPSNHRDDRCGGTVRAYPGLRTGKPVKGIA
jgi:hypothetical protein